jgi:hypothetical protein
MLVVLIVLAALPAAAADGPWTAAPVPTVGGGGGGHVMPAARAGRSTGPDHDAPFSGIPSRSTAANGATSDNRVNGVKTPDLSPR